MSEQTSARTPTAAEPVGYPFESTIEKTADKPHEKTWGAIASFLGDEEEQHGPVPGALLTVNEFKSLHRSQLSQYLTAATQGLDLTGQSVFVTHNQPLASKDVISPTLSRNADLCFCGDNYSIGPTGERNFDLGVMQVQDRMSMRDGVADLDELLSWAHMDPRAGVTVMTKQGTSC